MRLRIWLLLFAVLLALVPALALAAEPRSGDRVVIGPDETIDDDLYATGQNVEIQGTIRGDVIAVGASVLIKGNVTGDVLATGADIAVSGQVDGSVRAFGSSVTVSGAVGEDIVAAGTNVSTSSSATVGRDVLAWGSSVDLNGAIGRNVQTGAETVTIGASIEGNVDASANQLYLTDSASIGGDLIYTSDKDASISPQAAVGGSIERQEREREEPRNEALEAVAGWIRNLIGLFALGLMLVLPLPRFSGRLIDTIRWSPWASLGLGVGLFVATPIVALIVIGVGAFVGGWWLGLMALAVYGIALVLGFVVSALGVGRWILDRVGRADWHLAWALLLGLAILTIVGLIPCAGALVSLFAVFFGLGALPLAIARAQPL